MSCVFFLQCYIYKKVFCLFLMLENVVKIGSVNFYRLLFCLWNSNMIICKEICFYIFLEQLFNVVGFILDEEVFQKYFEVMLLFGVLIEEFFCVVCKI